MEFTIHFATINTQLQILMVEYLVHLQYTLLLLIHETYPHIHKPALLFTIHFATINTAITHAIDTNLNIYNTLCYY